jgi:hypothetical protein
MYFNNITNKVKNLINFFLHPKLLLIRITYIIKRLLFDFYFIFKKPYKFHSIFIAGMTMSSTTRVKNMCSLIPGYFTRHMPIPFNIRIHQNICNSAFRYSPSWSYSLFKTHLNPTPNNLSVLKNNNVKKIIVTYRDLRDVVLARYHRILKFPKKENEPFYLPAEKQYTNITKEDGIDHCIDVISEIVPDWIFDWFEASKINNNLILFCKFEDLVLDPKKEFKKILNFYEIKLSEKNIDSIIEKTKGNKKSMVKNLNEHKYLPYAYASNFRSGKIGGWKEEFTKKNIKKFKRLMGESLIKLNYEKDLNW